MESAQSNQAGDDELSDCRVVKLGGSLLGCPDTPTNLRSWLATRDKDERRMWVVGGGRWVDLIREFDQLHGLSDQQAHWAAIKTMEVTAMLLQRWFPTWPIVNRFEQLDSSQVSDQVLSPFHLLQTQPDELPSSWEVTSDSIAAWLAIRIGCRKLTLIKSCRPTGESLSDWASAGNVDAYLPRLPLVESLVIEWVNLTP